MDFNELSKLNEMVETMSETYVTDYLKSVDADIYCCSPDCLDTSYLDANI